MKKVLLIYCFLTLCVLGANAQCETITVSKAKYDNQVLELGSLKDSVKKLKTNNKNLDNNFKKANKELERLSPLGTTNKNLRTANDSLNNEINKKNETIRLKNDTLRQKGTTISELQKQLNNQKKQHEAQLTQAKEQAKNDGKSEIRKKIETGYLNKEFEALIAESTLETVERDMQLAEDKNVKTTLSQLNTFFSIKKSLNQPFDKNSNKDHLDKLAKLPEAPSIDKLKSELKSYEYAVEGLQKCLDEIMKLDTIVVVENSNSKQRKDKLDKISGLLSNYIYNYDAMNYPYLSDIIFKVLEIKFDDVNASVKDLRDKF